MHYDNFKYETKAKIIDKILSSEYIIELNENKVDNEHESIFGPLFAEYNSPKQSKSRKLYFELLLKHIKKTKNILYSETGDKIIFWDPLKRILRNVEDAIDENQYDVKINIQAIKLLFDTCNIANITIAKKRLTNALKTLQSDEAQKRVIKSDCKIAKEMIEEYMNKHHD